MNGPRFRSTIPFGQPHLISGATVPRSTQLRHDRHGALQLPVVVGARRDVAGRAITATITTKGVDLLLDIGASAGRHLDVAAGGYYLEPLLSGGRMLAVEVTALASWAESELRPAGASSIPPRPDVNLAPLPPIR